MTARFRHYTFDFASAHANRSQGLSGLDLAWLHKRYVSRQAMETADSPAGIPQACDDENIPLCGGFRV